ncbi:MAG TPA: efflux RND transporter periplasmic adaptor subunit [Thermoanaerobaculia bacterium]|nr:efflux RND transporter periplasmic adaptor subunit [Thermoanaerobaculia bacterium]
MSTDHDALEGLRIERRNEPAPAPRRGRWLAAAALLLVLALALGGWLSRPAAAPVRVAAVHQAGGTAAGAVLNATGYVTARRQATVSSKVTGKVVEVLIEEGMEVKQDQLLARLDAKTQQAALALAEAQLLQARRALEENEVRLRQAGITRQRQHRLLAGGATTQNDVEAADADADSFAARLALGRQQVEVASREVAARRQDVDDTFIRAPFPGVITTKDAQPGEMISPISAGGGFTRTGIGTLVDMASLEIDVDVNESYINRVRSGQHAEAVLDAYPDWRIPATVIAVVPSADRQKATVKVRLGFDRLDPRLLPDMGVKVAFLAEAPPPAAAALEQAGRAQALVSRAALRQDHGQLVAFVVRGDRVERRAVRITTAPGDEAAVVAGLTPGEQVVVDGPPDLADGRKVVVR